MPNSVRSFSSTSKLRIILWWHIDCCQVFSKVDRQPSFVDRTQHPALCTAWWWWYDAMCRMVGVNQDLYTEDLKPFYFIVQYRERKVYILAHPSHASGSCGMGRVTSCIYEFVCVSVCLFVCLSLFLHSKSKTAWAINVEVTKDTGNARPDVDMCFFSTTHTHTHNRLFTVLWNLSGTTRVSRYQKKHSPTHTHRGHQSF